MFGMTEKEFWEDDPQLYWSYQTFYLKKKKDEIEQFNDNAWLQGIYVLSALKQSLNDAFSKSVAKNIYPEKPLDFNKKHEEIKKLTKKEQEQICVEEFNSWARM